MKHGHNFRKRVIVVIIGLALAAAAFAVESGDLSKVWKSVGLLDRQTRSALASQERFFAGLFTLPSRYEASSDSEKARMVKQWIRELRGSNKEKNLEAAAYLGIVKAKAAARHLEELLSSGRVNGRARWVCTRSLGQTGSEESIPILISLLDHRNRNTRIYAKVCLAEITGSYFGDDKEKWKTAHPSEACTVIECKGPAEMQSSSGFREAYSSDRLDFRIPDTYGRVVDSQDYVNVPVLVMSGSCWCGGCQQDAEPLRIIAAQYASKGLQTIRTVAGDNELASLDFQKHYRLGFVHLLDTNRSFEKRYNRDGWTFLMLADRTGKIVYKVNSPHEAEWRELRSILSKMLSTSSPVKTVMRDGVAYMGPTLERTGEHQERRICERFPSVACGADGKVYVVFTTNRNSSSDIFLRVFDGKAWSQDIGIAATGSDEYDGSVLVDKEGRVWITWTSNSVGNKYDIFATSFTNPANPGAAMQLTDSADDAMHSRMACDDKGRIWVTYYKWHKLGRYSRDKEIYLRRFEQGEWSREVQLSPMDVPAYEDHSEPGVSARGNGVVVVWSWDFHRPNKGYSNEAEGPTIFMRPVGDKLRPGKLSSVSARDIDVTPAVVSSVEGRIWCAWDSLNRNQRKSICVANPYVGRDNPAGRIQALSGPAANVCSPCLVLDCSGRPTLLWSQTEDSQRWVLKRAAFDAENKQWSAPKTIESQGNPRYCSGACDGRGNVWISYSVETNLGREITARKLEKQRVESDSETMNHKPASGGINDHVGAVRQLRRAIDEKYSYHDLRGIEWDKLFAQYTPSMERAESARRFAETASRMLEHAGDMHLWVKIDGETIGGFRRNVRPNYEMDILRRTVPRWRDLNKCVSTGRFKDRIGYIMIRSWARANSKMITEACRTLEGFGDCRGLIVDVRPNSGGSEPLARQFAGCFVDGETVYAGHTYRDSNARGGFGEVRERVLHANRDGIKYRGRIAVLMGRGNMSSCEAFLLMMRQVPGCKLIGERSYGSSGNPKPFDLGNGVTVWLPSWKALRPDGTCFEGEGIEPDIPAGAARTHSGKRDRVLEAALRYLRANR